MKRLLITILLAASLAAVAWAQNASVAKIFMVNSNHTNFFVQVGEDSAWAFQYDCPPLSASGMIELDARFFKSYKVYYSLITELGKGLQTMMTYKGEGDPGTPLVLEIKAGNVYCLSASAGVVVYTLADPAGKDPRICFTNFMNGPPLTRIELGKAWGKDTALFTGDVGYEAVTEFKTFKPGTYNFFCAHPFYPDQTTVYDYYTRPLTAVFNKERAYYIFYFYVNNEALTGAVLDISPAPPELFAAGKYKVDLTAGKKKTSITWDITLKDQKITGTSTENDLQYRLEGVVAGDIVKIVCFKEKELVLFQGSKKGAAINGKFRIDLKPADEGTWKLTLQ